MFVASGLIPLATGGGARKARCHRKLFSSLPPAQSSCFFPTFFFAYVNQIFGFPRAQICKCHCQPDHPDEKHQKQASDCVQLLGTDVRHIHEIGQCFHLQKSILQGFLPPKMFQIHMFEPANTQALRKGFARTWVGDDIDRSFVYGDEFPEPSNIQGFGSTGRCKIFAFT